MSTIRWGIIGTGMIANVFAEALGRAKRGVKQAVGSRDAAKAKAFAAQHGFAASHGSYEALLADQTVDAVYVSTPHPLHHRITLDALAAGKHVLCEKPMGITAAECAEMTAAAKRAGRVLLEAFMYRCHPQTQRILELVRGGAIGPVRMIRSCFTYGMGPDYNVRTDPRLRGGGLYDVGCYCIDFSRMIAGEEPSQVQAVGRIDPVSGVDDHVAAVMRFPGGAVASFDAGIHSSFTWGAEIIGEKGRITIANPWKPDAKRATFTLVSDRDATQEIVIADGGDIYALEADHLAAVVGGAAPLMTAANAIGTAVVLDQLWSQVHASTDASMNRPSATR